MSKTFTIECIQPDLTLTTKQFPFPAAGYPHFYVKADFPTPVDHELGLDYELEWQILPEPIQPLQGCVSRTYISGKTFNVILKKSGTYIVRCNLKYDGKIINTKSVNVSYTITL